MADNSQEPPLKRRFFTPVAAVVIVLVLIAIISFRKYGPDRTSRDMYNGTNGVSATTNQTTR